MAQFLLDAATPTAPPAQHLATGPGELLRRLFRLPRRLGGPRAAALTGRLCSATPGHVGPVLGWCLRHPLEPCRLRDHIGPSCQCRP